MKSISKQHTTDDGLSIQWGHTLQAVGKLRIPAARKALGALTGLTLLALMLRELVLLMALPGGMADVAKIPILIVMSFFHYTFASFLAVFPLTLPWLAYRSERLGPVAALMLGPAALLGLHWLPRVGFELPWLGTTALPCFACVASALGGLELRSWWARTARSHQRGGAAFDWREPSLPSASLVVACAVWLWACLPAAL